MKWINKILKGDRVIWVVMFLLAIISMLAVYTSTSQKAFLKGGNTIYDETILLKHLGTLIAGFVMMIIASRIDYRHFSRIIELLLLFCIVLLIFTYFFGSRDNGASRRIMGFQPSELAKIVLITYLAKYIVIWSGKDYKLKDLIVPIFLPILLTVATIFTENLSTGALLFVVCISMLYIGQIKFKYIMALVGIAIAGFALYILTDEVVAGIRMRRYERVVAEAKLHPEDQELQRRAQIKPRVSRVKTWQRRIEDKANTQASMTNDSTNKKPKLEITDRNRQEIRAKMAVANGGLFGRGSGKSSQRNFLPKPFNDCIYAIIIEEYGLVGGIFVMLLYIILLTRSTKIMRKRPLTFGALMAFGIAFVIIIQAMINMGVSTGLFPITGQQLPFISMGGSSMVVTGFAIGMIISVTRCVEEEEIEMQKAELENEEQETEQEETDHE